MQGIIDTAADITIMDAESFKKVATTCRLRKKDYKPADKTPFNYDRKTFHLDGRIEIDISFGDRTMKTTIYIKLDASEPLLLSEGVCYQLGIVTYHPDVTPTTSSKRENTTVPAVRVRLIETIKLPPRSDRGVVAEVGWEPHLLQGPLLMEANQSLKVSNSVCLPDVLVSGEDVQMGKTCVILSSDLGISQTLEKGTVVGAVVPVSIVHSSEDETGEDHTPVSVQQIPAC